MYNNDINKFYLPSQFFPSPECDVIKTYRVSEHLDEILQLAFNYGAQAFAYEEGGVALPLAIGLDSEKKDKLILISHISLEDKKDICLLSLELATLEDYPITLYPVWLNNDQFGEVVNQLMVLNPAYNWLFFIWQDDGQCKKIAELQHIPQIENIAYTHYINRNDGKLYNL